MKKQFIAAIAIALAIVAHAAKVDWNSGIIYTASNAAGDAGNLMANASTRLVTAYLYTFDTLEAYNAAQGLSNEQLYNQYVGKKSTAVDPVSSGATGMANIVQNGLPDGSEAKPQTVYGVIIYVDTKTAESYDNVDAFVKTAFRTTSWQDSAGDQFTGLAGGKTAWTAVSAPEPTSGLLFVIGVGLMALRRRRA